MDATQFLQKAEEDAALRAFLEEVAGDAVERTRAGAEMAKILFGVASYALYLWLTDELFHRRARDEVELDKQQRQLTAALIGDGFSMWDASVVGDALPKAIAKRNEDDPALKVARAFLGTTKKG
jgi:hypothetical protein